MNTAITIQSLNNAYCKQLIELILPIQQLEFNVPVTLQDQPDLLDIETHYHATGGSFWGALSNGELVGSIALISTGHHAGAIRKMFIKKEFRGKTYGIAQQLLQTLIEYSRQQAITHLYLGTVDVLHAAKRFYERNGFQKIDKADLPAYFPVMAADNVFYHLHLTP